MILEKNILLVIPSVIDVVVISFVVFHRIKSIIPVGEQFQRQHQYPSVSPEGVADRRRWCLTSPSMTRSGINDGFDLSLFIVQVIFIKRFYDSEITVST